MTVLPRMDVGGAIGAGILAIYLVRGRAPEVYAGVFLVVAWLELYGTAIGTWEWAAVIPGTGIPQGNPPSGSRPAMSGSTSWPSRLPRGCSGWQSELRWERRGVDDDERGRRSGERDVELPQPLVARRDHGRFDHDHMIELEALWPSAG